MQVAPYRPSTNKVSFGSKRLFPVYVKKVATGEQVAAWFSRLNLNSDRKTMEQILKEWEGKPGVFYQRDISGDFNMGLDTYGIELNSSGEFLSLASITRRNDLNNFEIEYIQASPNSSFEAGSNRIYKKAGTALMYGLTRLAKTLNREEFVLKERMENFYTELGMKKRGDSMIFLRKNEENLNEIDIFLKTYKPKIYRSIVRA